MTIASKFSAALIASALLCLSTPTFAEDMTPIPYAVAEADSPETQEIWKGYGDAESWKADKYLAVFTAKLKTPEGDDLTISEISSMAFCGDTQCPVRVIRNGKVAFTEMACRYNEQHMLNKSMNTIFLCDQAYPTIPDVSH